MTEKLCVYCKHCFDRDDSKPNCNAGKITYYPQDIITGEQFMRYSTCEEMRNGGDCGREGRLFEENTGIVHWLRKKLEVQTLDEILMYITMLFVFALCIFTAGVGVFRFIQYIGKVASHETRNKRNFRQSLKNYT